MKVKIMAVKMKSRGLVAHLHRWGLKVVEKDGWRDRGRPYNFYPRAVICHHTASGAQAGNFASESIVTTGRSDLPGPLCQFLLGRDGTVKIIAAGYANHAGYGGPHAGISANQGNTYAVGIEAENNGVGEPWSKEQLNAYYRLCAALLVWLEKKDVNLVFGHKEWAPGRKIDPAGINMDKFREQVKNALAQGPSVKTVRLSRLRPGKRNNDVLLLKKRLDRRGFSTSDDTTNFFGQGLRKDYRHWQRSLGYTGDDADGIPGKESLQKLGFRVIP
jgi:hypothetical protein